MRPGDAYNLGMTAGSVREAHHSLANVGNFIPRLNYPALTQAFEHLWQAKLQFEKKFSEMVEGEMKR